MGTQGIVKWLKDEGRHEGWREGWLEGWREGQREARQSDLLTTYRTRFGTVPRKVRSAVERARDDVALARWVEIFVARSPAEIAAAVAEKKA